MFVCFIHYICIKGIKEFYLKVQVYLFIFMHIHISIPHLNDLLRKLLILVEIVLHVTFQLIFLIIIL